MLVPVQQYLTRERPQLAKEEKVWRMHLKLTLCVQNIGAMCFLITTMMHDAEAGCKAAESWLAPGLFMSSSLKLAVLHGTLALLQVVVISLTGVTL